MSRANSDTARLRRLRRLGHRFGLTILAASKPDPKHPGGGYMLSEESERRILLGDRLRPYCASLDDIEAYLDRMAETD